MIKSELDWTKWSIAVAVKGNGLNLVIETLEIIKTVYQKLNSPAREMFRKMIEEAVENGNAFDGK